jgi:pyruvate dehydrogenase E2 component (dihydrolipoamide acetyltransferase)
MKSFKLPDLGEGLFEVEIISWHVSVGDNVVMDQPLVSVETDKAVVEVPAPWAGRIAKIYGKPGDIIKTGEVLVDFEEGDRSDAGSVVGSVPTESQASSKTFSKSQFVKGVSAGRATPAVRSLAQQLGIDLSEVKGSGPGGSITIADVTFAEKQREDIGVLKGGRRSMVHHMALSHANVVPATLTEDVVIDHWFGKADVTVRLIKAIVEACKAVPALNAWFENNQFTHQEVINLGLAVDTEENLLVPVIRDVASLSEAQMRNQIESIKKAVKDKSIHPTDLKGQTITLSNFGIFSGRYATMVVIPPQVAIIGAGKIRKQVIVVDDKPTVGWVLPLSITFDHRVITGGEVARFLRALIASLEK